MNKRLDGEVGGVTERETETKTNTLPSGQASVDYYVRVSTSSSYRAP